MYSQEDSAGDEERVEEEALSCHGGVSRLAALQMNDR